MEQFKNTGYSAIGGILLSIIGITGQDIIKTIVLGMVGTVVSFSMSVFLAKLFRKKQQ